MSDQLDIWRATFQAIVPEDGQLELWLGPGALVEEATREEVEAQTRREADAT